MIAGPALIVSGMLAVPVAPLPASNTENVGVKLPETVGVPPRAPSVPIDIPFGKLLADQEGLPDSPVTVKEVEGYGRFTVETGRLLASSRAAGQSGRSDVQESGARTSVSVSLRSEQVHLPQGRPGAGGSMAE